MEKIGNIIFTLKAGNADRFMEIQTIHDYLLYKVRSAEVPRQNHH
jgi:hypothetical protein